MAAPPQFCMDRIRDLANYHKMVPKGKVLLSLSLLMLHLTSDSCSVVKSVVPYGQVKFPNVRYLFFSL
ncbi:hypothetical protein EON65_31445 [archaeon]|nr:MAG: hypothetical protein EON65_31445 [archaeon]